MKRLLVLRHVPHVSLGSIADVLQRTAAPFEQIDLFTSVPERLPLADASGLIVLGGPMSADDVDTYPYLAVELDWIREAVDRELPTLGVCLGAQLLAKAMGGRVFQNHVKEIGCYDLELLSASAEDPLFAGRKRAETVFQWHGDTFDLPAGAIHLAQTSLCPAQAFRYGPCAYGMQFHVEMTAPLLETWLADAEFDEELIERHISADHLRNGLKTNAEAINDFSECLLGRFVAICAAT